MVLEPRVTRDAAPGKYHFTASAFFRTLQSKRTALAIQNRFSRVSRGIPKQTRMPAAACDQALRTQWNCWAGVHLYGPTFYWLEHGTFHGVFLDEQALATHGSLERSVWGLVGRQIALLCAQTLGNRILAGMNVLTVRARMLWDPVFRRA